jgi:outer membrane immunogenic protein
MKKVLFALMALLIAPPALGADLRTQQLTPLPPTVTRPIAIWSGFYVGLSAGFGTADFDNAVTSENVTVVVPTEASGFLGGGFVGLNFQVTPWGVLGVEADASYANIEGSHTVTDKIGTVPFAFFADNSLNWLATARVRAGFLPFSTLMIYGTGGLAIGEIESTFSASVGSSSIQSSFARHFSTSETKTGWTVGGGAEWQFANSWLLRGEYLYVDLGSTDTAFSKSPHTMHIVRGGVGWRF